MIPRCVKITINWVGNTMLVSYIRRIVLWRVTRPTSRQTRLKTLHFSCPDPHRESGLAYLELAYFRVPFRAASPFFPPRDRRKRKKYNEVACYKTSVRSTECVLLCAKYSKHLYLYVHILFRASFLHFYTSRF